MHVMVVIVEKKVVMKANGQEVRAAARKKKTHVAVNTSIYGYDSTWYSFGRNGPGTNRT